MRRRARLDAGQLQALRWRLRQTKDGAEIKKIQAILLIEEEEDIGRITALTGFGRSRIFGLRQAYAELGIVAIESKRRRIKQLLTPDQLKAIELLLKTKLPEDIGYAGHPGWTTSLLAHHIKKTYDVEYRSKTSYYLLFRQAQFTYHLPGRKYERRSEAEVAAWQVAVTPKLTEAWNDPNTVILSGDEMSLSSQTTTQRIWLPVGQYPEITVSKVKESRSLYGFLNLKTGAEHAIKTKWQNMYITAEEVLPKLRAAYPANKLLIIWDQAGWHKGVKTQDWIKADNHTETIYFPAAAPDLNPQEHVWKAGRTQVTHNHFIHDIDAMATALTAYLNNTQFKYSFLKFSPN